MRRDGPLSAVAERHAYRLVPAGIGGLRVLGAAMAADTALTARVEAELRAHAAASPWNARDLALAHGRYGETRGHERLRLIALAEEHPREGVAEFQRERALYPDRPGNALHLGQA